MQAVAKARFGQRVGRPDDATARSEAVLALPENRCSLAALLAAVGDPSPDVARAALRRLATLAGVSEAPALRDLLLSCEIALTTDVATTLRAIGDRDTIALALSALRDEHYPARIAAANALAVFAESHTAGALTAALHDSVAGVRAAALAALARIGVNAHSAAACAALLEDELAFVRIAAIRAIATSPEARELLSVAIDDRDPQVRQELGRYSHMLSIEAARSLLRDPDPHVREAAVHGAGIAQVHDLQRLLGGDPRNDVRLAAAKVLGRLGDQRAVAALITVLADPDAIVAAGALSSLQALLTRPRLLDALLCALAGDRPPRLRRAAVYTLGSLRAIEARALLATFVNDPDADLRLALAHVARRVFTKDRTVLQALLSDRDPAVRHAAWLALPPEVR